MLTSSQCVTTGTTTIQDVNFEYNGTMLVIVSAFFFTIMLFFILTKLYTSKL